MISSSLEIVVVAMLNWYGMNLLSVCLWSRSWISEVHFWYWWLGQLNGKENVVWLFMSWILLLWVGTMGQSKHEDFEIVVKFVGNLSSVTYRRWTRINVNHWTLHRHFWIFLAAFYNFFAMYLLSVIWMCMLPWLGKLKCFIMYLITYVHFWHIHSVFDLRHVSYVNVILIKCCFMAVLCLLTFKICWILMPVVLFPLLSCFWVWDMWSEWANQLFDEGISCWRALILYSFFQVWYQSELLSIV